MSHVVTYPDPLEQVAALPADALPFYAEVFDVLELAPWSGLPYRDAGRPDAGLIFGAMGQDKVTYLILERDREVHVLIVQSLG